MLPPSDGDGKRVVVPGGRKLFRCSVARQNNANVMSTTGERDGQRAYDVREAAGLGEGDTLGRNK